MRKILDNPVPLFARKLAEAGIESADDLKSLDDIRHIPLTVKQDLRDSETEHPPWGDYRFTDPHEAVRLGTSTGTTGHTDHLAMDPARPLDRVRVGRPDLVALRAPARDDRDPRPSRRTSTAAARCCRAATSTSGS